MLWAKFLLLALPTITASCIFFLAPTLPFGESATAILKVATPGLK